MRIGLLADIHEKDQLLRAAISQLEKYGVDRMIVLGDVAFSGIRLAETVRLLMEHDIGGIFGNHDLGISLGPRPEFRDRFSAEVIDYMTGLQSTMNLGGCRFSHTAPWSDSTDPVAYYLDDHAHDSNQLKDYLLQTESFVTFIGHFHCWQISNLHGPVTWDGDCPIVFDPVEKYLVTVHAMMDGWTAIYDSETRTLIPIRI